MNFAPIKEYLKSGSGQSSGRLVMFFVGLLFFVVICDGLFLFTWLTIIAKKFPDTVGGIKDLGALCGAYGSAMYFLIQWRKTGQAPPPQNPPKIGVD